MASKHIQQAASPIKALYSIFIQPTLSTSRNAALRTAQPQLHHIPHLQTPSHTRAFTTSPTRLIGQKTRTQRTAREVREQKWNEEIKARDIYLVDPVTNLLVEEPVSRFATLRGLDLKTERLVQLSPDDPEDPDFIPVCKIVNKKEAADAERRKKAQNKETKQAAAKERSVKTVELNWAIDANDLAHRLGKVRGFLEEGRKVEFVFASKRRGRKATMAECQGMLDQIRKLADGVSGARESQEFEGKMGGFATLKYQGKAGAVAKEGGGAKDGATKEEDFKEGGVDEDVVAKE